ncbi:MAG: hypothetical protein CM1200mP1_10260 [Candidatus Neomarinimicrobiota bacterium]|nr:MAG: hypothetical protein CM1200mP1_10260 [Candidatus Neomarinimicrobiota bacterium]
MLKYKNFGRKSLTELVEKLDEMGINFGMDVDKYLKLESIIIYETPEKRTKAWSQSSS